MGQVAARRVGMHYGQFIMRWRWVIVTLWALALLASIPFSLHATDRLDTGGFVWNGSESIQAGDIINQKFGEAKPLALVVFHSDTVAATNGAFTREVQHFVARATTYPHVAAVQPGAVGADGRTITVTVAFNLSPDQSVSAMPAFHRILPRSAADGPARAYLTGDPAVYSQLTQVTLSDLRQSELFTLPIAAIALLIIFGTLASAAIPLLLAAMTIPLTLAVIYGISLHTDISIFVVNIASIIGLGISIDYSLFIVRRFRDELQAGHSVNDAVGIALATSGESILFSGMTVLVGFGALSLIGLPFMTSIAIGGVIIVALSLLGALTLVPAVLSIAGRRVIAMRFARPGAAARTRNEASISQRFWHRWAMTVMDHPWLFVIGVVAFVALLASPAFSLATGLPGIGELPPNNEARQGYDLAFPGNAAQQLDPIALVIQTRDGSPIMRSDNLQALCAFTKRIETVPNITSVIGLTANAQVPCAQDIALFANGGYRQVPALAQLAATTTRDDTTLVSLISTAPLDSPASKAIVSQLRALGPTTDFAVKVGGLQAISIDLSDHLYANFPRSLLFIFISTYILLLIMFRSLLLPLKAIIMNVLSVAAAWGVVVWVFQQGHLASQLRFARSGYVEMTTPILLFCILFGLSMDYEVFLLSRVREEWERTHDNRFAVARGLENTAGIITSAALMLIIVCAAFIFTNLTLTKEQGVGICIAVLVDATIIRLLLVPATMHLLGKWNWWLPQWQWSGRTPQLELGLAGIHTPSLAHRRVRPSKLHYSRG